MHLSSNILLAALSLAPSLSSAVTLQTNTWPNISVGNPVDIKWSDANGPVEVQLLYNPLPDPIILATGLTNDSYMWTPAANLSNGMYQVKLKDDKDSKYSNSFPLSGGVALGDKNPAMNDEITPPANVHGPFNHSMLNNSVFLSPFSSYDDYDDDDDLGWGFDTSNMSRAAVIGLSMGLAGGLAIFLVLLTMIWTYRKKYLDVLTKHGDLIRELYGDGGPPRRGDGVDVPEFEVMPVILEAHKPDDEFDPEQAKKDAENLRKKAEHEARVAKRDLVERWRREDEERARKEAENNSSAQHTTVGLSFPEKGIPMTEIARKDTSGSVAKGRDEHNVWEQDADAVTLTGEEAEAGERKEGWKEGKKLI